MRTELVTAPTLEPITLAEAKAHLRVLTTDDDAYIGSLIGVAREDCETHTRRAFLPQTWDLFLDTFPVWGGFANRWVREQGAHTSVWFPGSVVVPIELPRPPLISVTSIQYVDPNGTTQTLDASAYKVSLGTPGRIAPAYGTTWPVARCEMDAVQIRYQAGYASVNALASRVKQAVKLLVGHYYEHREAVIEGQQAILELGLDRLLAGEEWGGYG